jgi:glycine cleavage system H protein
MYPKEFRYTKDHEWIRVDGEVGVVGITEFAQSELGDVVFVELPEVGDQFDAGAEVGTIESVKAVSSLYSPVSGEIVEVNEALADKPELVNEDPHGDGWMMKVKLGDAGQVEELMSAEQYEEHAAED